jgi:hypothetical protein
MYIAGNLFLSILEYVVHKLSYISRTNQIVTELSRTNQIVTEISRTNQIVTEISRIIARHFVVSIL